MPALIWLIAGVALAAAELFTLDFVLIMLATGAFAAAGVGALGAGVLIQVVVFALVSTFGVAVARPAIKRMVHRGADDAPMGMEAIEGTVATVVDQVSADSGMIKIGGELWSARAFDATQVLEPGQQVRVVEIKGATALVWRE